MEPIVSTLSLDMHLRPLSGLVDLCRSLPSTPDCQVRISALAAMTLGYVPVIADRISPSIST